MNVACSEVKPILLIKSLKAVAETKAPAGMGTRPITAGTRCMASLDPMHSIAAANLVSKPFISIKRLKVRALATITSKLRVVGSKRVINISPGTECGGRISREMMRLAVKTAKQGGILSLIKPKIMAIDISKAIDGLNISAQSQLSPGSR